MKTVWLCAEAHHGKRSGRFFFVYDDEAKQSKAKQVLCIIRSYSVLSAGVYVRICVCFSQRLSHDRSLYASSCDLILFMSERYTFVPTRNDSAKPYHLFILLNAHTPNCGRYNDKSVSIASHTVQYNVSSVSLNTQKTTYPQVNALSICLVQSENSQRHFDRLLNVFFPPQSNRESLCKPNRSNQLQLKTHRHISSNGVSLK